MSNWSYVINIEYLHRMSEMVGRKSPTNIIATTKENSEFMTGKFKALYIILDFRLSPCTEYSKLSLG